MKKSVLSLLTAGVLFAQATALMAATVTINQFVEHPALDAISQGVQDSLAEDGVDAKFITHNAQANMGTAAQIAKQQIGEEADVIVAIATPSAQACVQAVNMAPEDMKRPVVFAGITDPLAAGLVKDINKPGGVATGASDKLPLDRQLEMIREFIGPFERLGFVYNASEENSKVVLGELKALAKEQGFKVVETTANKTADVYQAGKSLAGRVDVIFISTDNTVVAALESLVKVGMQSKIPIFAADVDSVQRGAIAALGIDYYKQGRVAGEMVKEILNGAQPADMPVAFMEELELHINLKSAKELGITPSQALLDKAVKVSE